MSRTVDLDIRGLVCPQTVGVVRRCLAEMEPDETLVVTGDEPAAARSIRRTCYKHGYNVLEKENDIDGEFTLAIEVPEDAPLAEG